MDKLLIFSCNLYQVFESDAFYTVNQVTKHLSASEKASDQIQFLIQFLEAFNRF